MDVAWNYCPLFLQGPDVKIDFKMNRTVRLWDWLLSFFKLSLKSCDVVSWHPSKSEEVTEDEDFIQLLTRIINLLAPLNIKKDSEELIFLKTKYVDVTTSGLQSNLTSGRNSSKSRKQRDGSRKNDYQTKMPINKSYYRPFSSIISDADKQARIYPG